MKKEEAKPLKERLLEAVNKALKSNKSGFTKKIDKVVEKSVKRIVERTDKEIKKTLQTK